MRSATLSEMLKSSQTTSLRAEATSDMQEPSKPSQLDKLNLRFESMGSEIWGLKVHGGCRGLLGGHEFHSRDSSMVSADPLDYDGYQPRDSVEYICFLGSDAFTKVSVLYYR